MPELPEVETTRRGIEPYTQNRRIQTLIIREHRLRWPIPADLAEQVNGQRIQSMGRRGKYLLFNLEQGTLLLHLGMSGSLRVVTAHTAYRKHDHLDFVLDNQHSLRFHDPRRFGSLHWTTEDPLQHRLLTNIGIEPLSEKFTGACLHEKSRSRKVAIKNFIMNSQTVAGIGNIYANEALFLAGIHPAKAASHISLEKYTLLVKTIKKVLQQAIRQGGTTLRDFVREDGSPGYFQQKLKVYERTGLPCVNCATSIKMLTIGQRSSYYCARCQK